MKIKIKINNKIEDNLFLYHIIIINLTVSEHNLHFQKNLNKIHNLYNKNNNMKHKFQDKLQLQQ